MTTSVMTYSEAKQEYGSQYRVVLAVDNGQLYHLGHGMYAKCPRASDFEIIAKKYPHAIVASDTAYFLHGLTDVIPAKIHLATKRNTTRITAANVIQVFVEQRLFNPGKSHILYDGAEINIYDKERMLIELLRRTKSTPFDYYKELIASYRQIAQDLDFYKLESYINLYKRSTHLLDALQREVL
jgi:predicted transcriptional regulator of viral defense system